MGPQGILLIVGIGLSGALLSGSLFKRMRVPQVVAYIAVGVLCGDSVLGIIGSADVHALRPLNTFALGVIGFLVGGELSMSTFRRYGRQFAAILLGEGVLAFVLVAASTGFVLYRVSDNATAALAGAAIFGAIASATDPASTVSVLWEYRCKGALTTALTAIVALDDALAMTLYGLGTATAQMLTGSGGGLVEQLLTVGFELGGAVALGAVGAWVLALLLRHWRDEDRTLGMALGVLLLLIGTAAVTGMDVIMAAMTTGAVLRNVAPTRSHHLLSVVRSFSDPIYVMFFVLVGARLNLDAMPGWLWGVVALYIIGRSAGKIFGAWCGARATGAQASVRRHLGVGLFAQGGVAVGLSILAGSHLNNIVVAGALHLGDAVVFTVTATTLCLQLIGPPLVKFAVARAAETGRSITEEDALSRMAVGDAVERVDAVLEGTPVATVVDRFAAGHDDVIPVVANDGSLRGLVAFNGLRDILPEPANWPWMVAADLALPSALVLHESEPLRDSLAHMHAQGQDAAAVVDRDEHLRGVLTRRGARDLARRTVLQATATEH